MVLLYNYISHSLQNYIRGLLLASILVFGSFSVIYSYSLIQLAYSSSGGDEGGDNDGGGGDNGADEEEQQEEQEQPEAELEEVVCDDGIDNDQDGLVDLDDTEDCGVIQPFPTTPGEPLPTIPSPLPPDNGTAPDNQTTTNVTAAAVGPTAKLVVTKNIVGVPPGRPGPLASHFNIQITGNSPSPSSFSGGPFQGLSFSRTITLSPGDYEVTETRHTSPGVAAGYTPSYSADCTGTIAAGETKSCTVTNIHRDLVAKLVVKKEIVRLAPPGTILPPFTIEVTGIDASPSSFGGRSSTTVILRAGDYKVTESSIPPGYTPSYSADCTGTIAAGETKTCTVTNTDTSIGILKVIKKVETLPRPVQVPVPVGAPPSAFTIEVTGSGGKVSQPSPSSFPGKGGPDGTTITVAPGSSYRVTETGGPPQWIPSYSADCTGTIAAAGETKTCTVTNTHRSLLGTVTVIKQVINDNGGTKIAADFKIDVGPATLSPSPSSFQGAGGGGTAVTLRPGTYSVTEDQDPGYTTTLSGDCTRIAIAARQTKTCTITNDDKPSTLTVIKQVINDNGGTKIASDFNIQVAGNNPSPSSFPGQISPGTAVTLGAGPYSVTEAIDPSYSAIFSPGCSGSIGVGQTASCVITNDDIPRTGGPGPGGPGPGGGGGPGPSGPGGEEVGQGETLIPPISELITENATVDVGTIKLGDLSLVSGALMRLATVAPLNIMGGHLSLNLPPNSNITVLAAQSADNATGAEVTDVAQQPFENVVIANLTKILDIKAGEETLYQANISSSMSGINPFTNRSDIVSNITDLLLWNSNSQKPQEERAVEFNDDNAITMNIIYGRSGITNIPIPVEKPQTIPLDNFTFSSGGLLPVADISPFQIIGGNVSLNLTSASSLAAGTSLTTSSNDIDNIDDINLIAAQQIDTDSIQGAPNAVIVNLTKTVDPLTGEMLRNVDLENTMGGIDMFTGEVDTVSGITNLFLWNSNPDDIRLGDKSAVSMTLVFE